MSYNGIEDKDLPLKLRMMNLLWHLGWLVRPNVKLYRYEEGKRTSEQFTDIDVLAIKLLPLQSPIVAICSAKSGKESDSSQIFWLAGVKSYFGASFAYYLRSKASLQTARPLCEKLDIIALNEEQLGIIEDRFSITPFMSDLFDIKTYKQIHSYLMEVKEKKPGLYNYISERFWTDPMNNQLLRITTAILDLKPLTLSPQCKIYMKYYLASLLALPLYRLTYHLIAIPSNKIREEIETALMGGELPRLEKERIVTACKTFVSELVAKATLTADAGKDSDFFFRNIFRIKYTDDLADLLISLVEHYNQAIYTPRMLDVLSYQISRNPSQTPRIEKVTLPDLLKNDWEYSAKLTEDILIFIQRIGGFEKSEIAT